MIPNASDAELNLHMTDAQYKECTTKVKALADIRPIAIDDADSILRTFHQNVKTGADAPLIHDLSAEEQAALAQKEAELAGEPEKRALEAAAARQAEAERTANAGRT